MTRSECAALERPRTLEDEERQTGRRRHDGHDGERRGDRGNGPWKHGAALVRCARRRTRPWQHHERGDDGKGRGDREALLERLPIDQRDDDLGDGHGDPVGKLDRGDASDEQREDRAARRRRV